MRPFLVLTDAEIRLLLSLPISQFDNTEWADVAASAKRHIAEMLPPDDPARKNFIDD